MPVKDGISNEDAAQYLVNPVTGTCSSACHTTCSEWSSSHVSAFLMVITRLWNVFTALGFLEDLKIPKGKYLLQNAANR